MHPVPKPLWGVAPRTLMTASQWDKVKIKCHTDSGWKCEACGVEKVNAHPLPRLDCHEVYIFNYPLGTSTFVRFCSLCGMCHSYIHETRLTGLVMNGACPEHFYDAVIAHGEAVLRAAGLKLRPEVPPEETWALWDSWRLLLNGKEHKPKFISARHADIFYAAENSKQKLRNSG